MTPYKMGLKKYFLKVYAENLEQPIFLYCMEKHLYPSPHTNIDNNKLLLATL